MATSKKTIQIIVDDATYKAFEDFRFNNRFSSASKAGIIILHAGMNALKDEYPELDLTTKLETGKKETNDGVIKQKNIRT